MWQFDSFSHTAFPCSETKILIYKIAYTFHEDIGFFTLYKDLLHFFWSQFSKIIHFFRPHPWITEIYKLKIQSNKEIFSLKALFTYNILFLIYTLFKVNIINNCRINSNYSLAFKLETISIVLIFLANNLFITYETKTVPMIAYT